MEDIRLYDFKKSEKFSIENIKNLIQTCENFCKTSNMQISYEAKSDNLKLSVDKSGQSTYGEFIENIKNDSIVVEYNIYPLVENLTLFIDKTIALRFIDLMLGGNGKLQNPDREPTNIDIELLKCLVENLLKKVSISYQYDSINILKIYTNPLQYQKVKNNEMVFKSLINVTLSNNTIGNMRFCTPYRSMETVLNDLRSNEKNEDEANDNNVDISSNDIFNYVKNVDIDVFAKLGSAKISINDLLNLEEGDVILLDQKVNNDITVTIGEAEMFKARPGVIGIKRGLEITDIINGER